jgi:hypothetical protein
MQWEDSIGKGRLQLEQEEGYLRYISHSFKFHYCQFSSPVYQIKVAIYNQDGNYASNALVSLNHCFL